MKLLFKGQAGAFGEIWGQGVHRGVSRDKHAPTKKVGEAEIFNRRARRS